MYALFVVLNAVDYLEDILTGFLDKGIKGATIVESQGMGKVIANSNNDDIPMFGALRMLLQDSHPYSKTIFTVLENEEMVDTAVGVVQDAMEYCSTGNYGFMFTVPIGKVYKMCRD